MGRTRRGDGEEALIQTYFAPLAAGLPGAHGLLDDCASLPPRAGEDLIVTTDAVAAGVHFFPDDTAGDIAWKALAVNVSDLVSKGAAPTAYVMALAFPEQPEPEWLRAFSHGLAEAQAAFGIKLAGGDTDRRSGPLAITITAFGYVPAGRMVRRATAGPGDAVFVSGTIGDSALGLQLRRDAELAARWGLDQGAANALIARYLRPEPRVALGPALLECASAAMDISDGLAKDLDRLARASGVGARVIGSDIPLSAPARRALDRARDLFPSIVTGGDDYEILAAVPQERCSAFREATALAGIPVTEIGRLQVGSGIEITGPDGAPLALERLGWDHF
jgi:thiamine-monophosphate kinase